MPVDPKPKPVEMIRLCVETHHPIDPGNYEGPTHCLAHPQGHECETALFARWPDVRDAVIEKLRADYLAALEKEVARAR